MHKYDNPVVAVGLGIERYMAWQEERDQIVKRETRLNQLSSKAQPAHSRKRKRHQLHEQFDELFKVRVAPGSINTA